MHSARSDLHETQSTKQRVATMSVPRAKEAGGYNVMGQVGQAVMLHLSRSGCYPIRAESVIPVASGRVQLCSTSCAATDFDDTTTFWNHPTSKKCCARRQGGYLHQ